MQVDGVSSSVDGWRCYLEGHAQGSECLLKFQDRSDHECQSSTERTDPFDYAIPNPSLGGSTWKSYSLIRVTRTG